MIVLAGINEAVSQKNVGGSCRNLGGVSEVWAESCVAAMVVVNVYGGEL